MGALPPLVRSELQSLTSDVLGLRHSGVPVDQIRDYIDDRGARLMHAGLSSADKGTLVSCLASIQSLAG